MPELTITQAASVVRQERSTVWHWLKDGLLLGERRGRQDKWFIKVDDLRQFAAKHNYKFDEDLAQRLMDKN